jgi:hypothetical protein
MKTGFLRGTRNLEEADFSWRIRLLRVDSFAQETRFLGFLVLDDLFTLVVKPGFGDHKYFKSSIKQASKLSLSTCKATQEFD